MMQHYGVGEKIDAKNASVAGLLGGMQQMGARWFVTWGKFPMADRRLVVLEEVKGASTEVLGKLTDMRSSGIAEIDKIGGQRRAPARTRLLAISNPRSDVPLSSYNFGVEAVLELIGGPEDVRRFDFAYLASASQVPTEELNKLAALRPQVEHTCTSELSRKLIMWAWTLRADEVRFDDDATKAILDHTANLCTKYTEAVPLVDRGSMRLKLARLSAALAVRTFSCFEGKLRVRKCHVDYIVEFIDRVYSDPLFGYADFSAAYQASRQMRSGDDIRKRMLATPFPGDFIEAMLHTTNIELRDICDWCGWEKGEALELLSFLVRKRALFRDGRAYKKNAQFIAMLKALQISDDLKKVERPDYVREEF
jgi:hypothetical protein